MARSAVGCGGCIEPHSASAEADTGPRANAFSNGYKLAEPLVKKMEFVVKTDKGNFDLEASVRFVGKDLLVAIWGGERPHIGAVAIAQPRPSLKDPAQISSTGSVFCLMGHKEDDLAKAVAEILAAAINTTVVVTAGIHWHNISEEGIRKVTENSQILIELIMDQINKKMAREKLKG